MAGMTFKDLPLGGLTDAGPNVKVTACEVVQLAAVRVENKRGEGENFLAMIVGGIAYRLKEGDDWLKNAGPLYANVAEQILKYAKASSPVAPAAPSVPSTDAVDVL